MQSRSFKKPGLVTVVFESLIIILLAGGIILPDVIERYINNSLVNLNEGSVGKVAVIVLKREIAVTDLKLDKLQLNRSYIISGTVKKLKVSGIPVLDVLLKRPVIIERILFRNPELELNFLKNNLAPVEEKMPLLKLTNIDRLQIEKGFVKVNDSLGGKYMAADFFLEMPVHLDSITINNFQQEFSFKSGVINYYTADGLYHTSIRGLKGSSDKKEIVVDSVKVIPQYSENEFRNHLKYQSDRFDFVIPRIVVTLPSNENYIKNNFHAQHIHIQSPELKVYRDKRIARDPVKRFKSLQHYLEEISFNLLIDSFLVEKATIRYRERMETSDETGEINFFNALLRCQRIKSGENTDSALTIRLQTGFMKSAAISAQLNFPYGKNHFNCEGVVTGLPMTELNRITGPNAGMVFNDGTMEKVQFKFIAYNSYSSGYLDMHYRNLDFTVKNKPGGTATGLLSKIKTMAAGIFIKKDKRKPDEDIFLTGTICHERLTDRFVFNYIWKSIFSGIKSAMIDTFTPEPKSKSEKSPC